MEISNNSSLTLRVDWNCSLWRIKTSQLLHGRSECGTLPCCILHSTKMQCDQTRFEHNNYRRLRISFSFHPACILSFEIYCNFRNFKWSLLYWTFHTRWRRQQQQQPMRYNCSTSAECSSEHEKWNFLLDLANEKWKCMWRDLIIIFEGIICTHIVFAWWNDLFSSNNIFSWTRIAS